MKIRLFAALMIALLVIPLSGCSLRMLEARLDALEQSIDQKIDTTEDAAEAVIRGMITPATENPAPAEAPAVPEIPAYDPHATEPSIELLTKEEAEAIVLNHAGLTADQLLYLHTELDYDNGHRKYDIEFQIDRWEYDYALHAETGEILSWDKDWDD